MHTEMLKPSKLLMVDDNGNQMEINGTIEFEPVDYESTVLENPCKNTSITSLSMNIKIDKSIYLTRKKFVKLLMSKGIGRNGANEIAKYVLKKNSRYTLFDLMLW